MNSGTSSLMVCDYELREWHDHDDSALLELARLGFGDCELSSPLHFDWQYRRCPAGRAILVCAYAAGKPVAVVANVPMQFVGRGEDLIASQSVNVLTHPDHRGKGLFVRCAKAACDLALSRGHAFILGFPNPAAKPGWERLGHAGLGVPRMLLRMLRPLAIVAEVVGKSVPAPATLDAKLGRFFTRVPRSHIRVEEVRSFESIDLSEFEHPQPFYLARNSAWFEWRYVKIPYREYRIFVAGSKQRPQGVMVCRASAGIGRLSGRTVLHLMDLQLKDVRSTPESDALIAALVDTASKEGAVAIAALASPGSKMETLLRGYSFMNVPERLRIALPIVVRPGYKATGSPSSINELDISFGMTDRC